MHAIAAFDPLPVEDHRALVDVELPMPDHGPLDLLIRVEAVSVNPVDVGMRRRAATGGPRVLGYDGAGVVESVGDHVSGFSPGDAVWWAGDLRRPGSNADYQAVDHRVVARMPPGWSFADAAALPLTGLTALEAFEDHLHLGAESEGTMLMVGGAGGVGSVAIQLAKATTLLQVIATASREASAEWVRAMGADAVVDHRDLLEGVRRAAPDGVQHVLSAYSDGNLDTYAQVCAPFGHVVALDPVTDASALRHRSIALHAEYMFTRPTLGTADLDRHGQMLARLAHLAQTGDVRTTANERIDGFTAASMREAHRRVESRSMIGKVVVHR